MKAHPLLLVALVLWGHHTASADVPHLIRYQGQAVDSQGVPLEGPYALTFRLYDAEMVGTKVWEEAQTNVPLQGGHFSVLLGQVTPLTTMDWSHPRWLSVQVGSDPELAPRQQITSVPLAIMAEQVGGIIRTVGNNVGIGTTTPTNALSVYGASAGYGAEDVTVGGTATASYVDPCCAPANAFDSDNATVWGINFVSRVTSYPVWLTYDFGAGQRTIVKYTITPDRCGSNPGSWQFQGSHDNTNWTVLDIRSSFGVCSVGMAYPFTFSNTTAYRYYRLYILAPANGNLDYDIDFLDMAMMEAAPGPALEVLHSGGIKFPDGSIQTRAAPPAFGWMSRVSPFMATSSSTYVDVSPSDMVTITLPPGTTGKVLVQASVPMFRQTTGGTGAFLSLQHESDGAVGDLWMAYPAPNTGGYGTGAYVQYVFTELSPGPHTFRLMYRSASNGVQASIDNTGLIVMIAMEVQ